MSIDVIRINRVQDQGDVRAFADVKVETNEGELIMKGFRIVESRGRTFVGWPAKKGSDDRYHMTVFTNNQAFKNSVSQIILNSYFDN